VSGEEADGVERKTLWRLLQRAKSDFISAKQAYICAVWANQGSAAWNIQGRPPSPVIWINQKRQAPSTILSSATTPCKPASRAM
jgi:hypothetical protein